MSAERSAIKYCLPFHLRQVAFAVLIAAAAAQLGLERSAGITRYLDVIENEMIIINIDSNCELIFCLLSLSRSYCSNQTKVMVLMHTIMQHRMAFKERNKASVVNKHKDQPHGPIHPVFQSVSHGWLMPMVTVPLVPTSQPHHQSQKLSCVRSNTSALTHNRKTKSSPINVSHNNNRNKLSSKHPPSIVNDFDR